MMNPQPSLGESLRKRRQARKLSLNQLAAATGISASFLSLVENGKSDITIGRLTRLVNYLDISITDLLPTPEPADSIVVQPENRRLVHSPTEGTDVFLLVHSTDHGMMPMYLELEPGAHLAEFAQHEGEEWVYVLEGTLVLELGDEPPRSLGPGASAYYSAMSKHLFRNEDSEKILRLICVNSPPIL